MSNLTAERLRDFLHYDPDTGVFTWIARPSRAVSAGTIAGCPNEHGYRLIQFGGKIYQAHRLAWLYMTGEWPKDQIDHINRTPGDDRWCNLREADGTQNQANQNRSRNNTVGYKGVTIDRKRRNPYKATITVRGRCFNLGRFATPEEAHSAYCAAARKHFGEFASAG